MGGVDLLIESVIYTCCTFSTFFITQVLLEVKILGIRTIIKLLMFESFQVLIKLSSNRCLSDCFCIFISKSCLWAYAVLKSVNMNLCVSLDFYTVFSLFCWKQLTLGFSPCIIVAIKQSCTFAL